MVAKILRNRIYTGVLVWGARSLDPRRLSGKARARNETPHAVREGACPAIVRPEQFEQAAALRAQRPRPGKGSGRAVSSRHLLTGLLRCGACGWSVVARPAVPGTRLCHDYYRCTGAQSTPHCRARAIRMDLLDRLVVQALLRRYGTALQRQGYAAAVFQRVSDELQEAEAALAHLQQTVARAEQKGKRIRSLLLKDEISTRDYRQLMADLEAEKEQLREQERRLQEQIAAHRRTLGAAGELEAAMADLDKWDHLEPVERKEVLRKFLERVDVCLPRGEDHLQVVFRWRDRREQPETQERLSVPGLSGRSRGTAPRRRA